MESFEPWLSRVEEMEAGRLWEIAEAVPPEWYGGDALELEQLMERMLSRRTKVRDLIGAFRDSERRPFPAWGSVGRIVMPRAVGLGSEMGKFVM